MRAGMSVHGGCGRSPYVNREIKNERMKRYIFCISLCLGVVSGGRAAAQEPPAEPEAALLLLEVKTNALYWTTASLNAGFEVGLTPRITFEIDAGYNPWTFSDNRKFKFWMIQPEIRHWFRNRFEGHFLGVHLLYADFNVGGMKFLGMSDRRYQGALYGAGVAYGYRWPLGKNWSVEATAALGYLRSDYERYVWKRCGRYLGRGHKNYFGPTKIGVSFCFAIE